MPIIGFGFDKIIAEKKEPLKKQDKLKTNVNIVSINEEKLKIGKDEKQAIKVLFEFKTEYGSAGEVIFHGHIIYFESPERINEIISLWTKEQKFNSSFGELVYNFILAKSNIRALSLEQDVGLPYHLALPRVKINKKQ